ncbi:MAG TPA: MauE/DoxX family redox-associated membrane protein [Actinokineospora sp.]|jgi:hypothetical protein|nr:MauE/DoxX family redox-associated membrane protein [Actinokineospora sp.]
MDYFVLGARLLIGVVFLVAAVMKSRGAVAWRSTLESVAGLTRLRRLPMIRFVAGGVVATEIGTAALLAVESTVPFGFMLGLALLLGFSGAIAVALRGGSRQPCNCFGSGGDIGVSTLVRNGVLAAVAVGGLTHPVVGTLDPRATALTVAVAVTAAAFVVFAQDLTELFAVKTSRGDS